MNRKSFGFTLIELLIVIAIIGILAGGTLVAINPLGKMQQARDAIRKDNLRGVANALEAYYIANLSYPSTGGAWWAEGKCDPTAAASVGWILKPNYSGVNAYISNLAPSEIKILPGDPNVNGISVRCYVYVSDGVTYELMAHQGAEAPFNNNDPMIRQYSLPTCNNIQPTFIIKSDGTRCY